ncbi:hypothetical protein [Methanosphaerula palustris]|uniref:Uncharacterized protein n=1 Tax=Methanosphaerula palustris (strain ATCC BAA-1556 / DSM 19958 / E1-9c) TaxID=521011 RepID=B8GEP4_METPE|nr:hypothetical protein [Methanosphaerula palustris]ACL17745.1 conserved hypothetical protein [Methanosphaerula palustris E1-9c]
METFRVRDAGTWQSASFCLLLFAAAFTLLSILTHNSTQIALSPNALLPIFGGGLLIGLILWYIMPRTSLVRADLFVLVTATLFVIQSLSNMIEAYFFTSSFSSPGVFAWGIGVKLVLACGEAGAAVLLFTPQESRLSLIPGLREYLSHRSTRSWAWRMIAGSVLYLPVYFLFGALISSFVIPFYTDPTLGLTIPSISLIIPLELIRGFLYMCVLMPWFAMLKIPRRSMMALLALILYIPGALIPLLTVSSLPPQIIPFHLVEILCDTIGYGILLTLALYTPQSVTIPAHSPDAGIDG